MSQMLKVGWIGTGVMGAHMARHLMHNGYKTMSVFNRTASKADGLVSEGAKFMQPREVAENSDIVFLMLGFPQDVETMVLDPQNGILPQMKAGSILVDHTTSSPGLATRIAQQCAAAGVGSLDAPVSGGDIGAKNGKLVTMVGGDQEIVAQAKPLLDCYSAEVQHLGKAGAGQHTKAANQIFIASTMIATCEGLLYGHKAGLDLEQMISLLSKGAAGSFCMEKLGPRMLRRDFDPGFYVEHFLKDLGICLEESKKMNLSLPGLALAESFYRAFAAQGGARQGTQGLIQVLEAFNNTKIDTYGEGQSK